MSRIGGFDDELTIEARSEDGVEASIDESQGVCGAYLENSALDLVQ